MNGNVRQMGVSARIQTDFFFSTAREVVRRVTVQSRLEFAESCDFAEYTFRGRDLQKMGSDL